MEASAKQRIKNDYKLFSQKWGGWDHVIDSLNEKDLVEAGLQPEKELPEE
jgi:hypothetical protein